MIILTPKDESGIERNQTFYHINQDGLPHGGKIEIQPDGVVKCRWEFPQVLPDFARKSFLKRWSAQLDEAKKRADNFDYTVKIF